MRLVRTGLQVVALEDNGGRRQSWSHAAHDLIRLGYGRMVLLALPFLVLAGSLEPRFPEAAGAPAAEEAT